MKIGSVHGIIMFRDVELCEIWVTDNSVEYRVINPYYPHVPFSLLDGYSKEAIWEWVQDRLPEDNRQNLLEDCARLGIQPIAEEIFTKSSGRVIDSDSWLKMPDGPQTFEEMIKFTEKNTRVCQ